MAVGTGLQSPVPSRDWGIFGEQTGPTVSLTDGIRVSRTSQDLAPHDLSRVGIPSVHGHLHLCFRGSDPRVFVSDRLRPHWPSPESYRSPSLPSSFVHLLPLRPDRTAEYMGGLRLDLSGHRWGQSDTGTRTGEGPLHVFVQNVPPGPGTPTEGQEV